MDNKNDKPVEYILECDDEEVGNDLDLEEAERWSNIYEKLRMVSYISTHCMLIMFIIIIIEISPVVPLQLSPCLECHKSCSE